MRLSTLFALLPVMVIASAAAAEDLEPIGTSADEAPSLYYSSPVADEQDVTSLAPVDASYYSSATPIVLQSPCCVGSCAHYGTSPACCSSSSCSGGSTYSPCTVYSPCSAHGVQAGYQPVVVWRPVSGPGGYRIGRGVVGQPKLYVSGQPLRNSLRFITP